MTPHQHTPHEHFIIVGAVLGLPIFVTFLMEAAESLVETLGWRVRLVRSGWDLCVLAVGSTGGIFTLPDVIDQWGGDSSTFFGMTSLLLAFFFAVLIIHIRKTEPKALRGWQSFLAIGLGIAALSLPCYFVLTT
jgi:hypothetical protein